MARTKAVLGSGVRLADHLTIGYLAMNCPLDRVREVLNELGVQSKRRRDLTSEVVFYYTLALCLYRTVSYEDVLHVVIESLRSVYGDEITDIVPSKVSISRARARLGSLPFEKMYRERVQAVGHKDMYGVMYNGLRVMAIDGSTLDVADEKANDEHYGRPGSSRGESAFPQLRFVALAECATHVMTGAQLGPYSISEQELARGALRYADSSMLVLADRGFAGYPTWFYAGKQGCRRLFRIKSNQIFKPIHKLSDGSFISEIYPDFKVKKQVEKGKSAEGVERVRILEYEIVKRDSRGKIINKTKYRLMTDLLDDAKAPIHELAALYHRRWKIEMALDELKIHLNEKRALRSKTPELVRQEFYALILVHGAIRKMMTEAAGTRGMVPEDLSFTGALRVIERRLRGSVSFPPSEVQCLA